VISHFPVEKKHGEEGDQKESEQVQEKTIKGEGTQCPKDFLPASGVFGYFPLL
jgi:hypothetical protein